MKSEEFLSTGRTSRTSVWLNAILLSLPGGHNLERRQPCPPEPNSQWRAAYRFISKVSGTLTR